MPRNCVCVCLCVCLCLCLCLCHADTKLRQSESFCLLLCRFNGPILAYLFEKYQVSSAQRTSKCVVPFLNMFELSQKHVWHWLFGHCWGHRINGAKAHTVPTSVIFDGSVATMPPCHGLCHGLGCLGYLKTLFVCLYLHSEAAWTCAQGWISPQGISPETRTPGLPVKLLRRETQRSSCLLPKRMPTWMTGLR